MRCMPGLSGSSSLQAVLVPSRAKHKGGVTRLYGRVEESEGRPAAKSESDMMELVGTRNMTERT